MTAAPGTRRLYSNAGFEVLGDHIAKATDIPFARVPAPGGAGAAGHDRRRRWTGSPAKDGVSTVDDLVRFAAELQAPRLLDPRRSRRR